MFVRLPASTQADQAAFLESLLLSANYVYRSPRTSGSGNTPPRVSMGGTPRQSLGGGPTPRQSNSGGATAFEGLNTSGATLEPTPAYRSAMLNAAGGGGGGAGSQADAAAAYAEEVGARDRAQHPRRQGGALKAASFHTYSTPKTLMSSPSPAAAGAQNVGRARSDRTFNSMRAPPGLANPGAGPGPQGGYRYSSGMGAADPYAIAVQVQAQAEAQAQVQAQAQHLAYLQEASNFLQGMWNATAVAQGGAGMSYAQPNVLDQLQQALATSWPQGAGAAGAPGQGGVGAGAMFGVPQGTAEMQATAQALANLSLGNFSQ